ncbi:MAG: hypothetical protein QM698_00635 [Micropepsaceae bacterium]
MIYLFGGMAVLVAGLILFRTLANMDPARLARFVRWVGIAVLVAAGLFLLTREAVFPALIALGFAAFLRYQAAHGWRLASRGGAKPTAGQTSRVLTAYLDMTLDHATGETSGLVLQGRSKGRRLSEMTVKDLLALLAELRVEDPDGAQLLDAYLARVHPGADHQPPPRSSGSGMSVDEALDILGLDAGATEADIRDAHRRLMQQLHPDRGGTDYLAAKINAARDALLG